MRNRSLVVRGAIGVAIGLAILVIVGFLALRGWPRRTSATTARTGSGSPAAPPYQPGGPRPAYLASLSEAEFRFGVSPTRNKDVDYQDSVLIMEHGADAIKSYSSNGITWTFDATAPQVDQIRPGRVVFATARAVGRVVGMQRTGNLLAVTFGPIAITDVIKRVDMDVEQPVDMNQAISYVAPDYPGAFAKLEPTGTTDSAGGAGSTPDTTATATPAILRDPEGTGRLGDYLRPAVWRTPPVTPVQGPFSGSGVAAQAVNALGPILGIPGAVTIDNFNVTPFCCGGLGIRAVRKGADLEVLAEAALQLHDPSIHFYLNISGGHVQRAGVELKGAAGLLVKFAAGTAIGLAGNINETFAVPVDLCIPIIGKAVPVVATLRQTFLLKTGFSAKNSTLQAVGDYDYQGAVFMGFVNGSWTVSAPQRFSVRQSLVNSISGASIGINALILGYGARVIVGIGAFGFATGPFLSFDTVVGATRGTDIAFPCHTGILNLSMKVGVGYQIPQPITKVINFFLRALNMKTIDGAGGIGHEETLVHKAESVPHNCGPNA